MLQKNLFLSEFIRIHPSHRAEVGCCWFLAPVKKINWMLEVMKVRLHCEDTDRMYGLDRKWRADVIWCPAEREDKAVELLCSQGLCSGLLSRTLNNGAADWGQCVTELRSLQATPRQLVSMETSRCYEQNAVQSRLTCSGSVTDPTALSSPSVKFNSYACSIYDITTAREPIRIQFWARATNTEDTRAVHREKKSPGSHILEF